jgi:hypothetical protein
MINYDLLPDHLRAGMRRYVECGIETGSFLRAVLENDLEQVISRAAPGLDQTDLYAIALFVRGLPAEAWGSPEKVRAWIAKGREAQRREDFGPHGDATVQEP